MPTEQFANNAASTLNGAINNSVTSLVVTSAASFPSAPNFRIIIDNEIFLVTAVSGTTFTVTRGSEGTTAATHSNGAAVTHVLTAAALLAGIVDPSQSTLSGTTAGTAVSSQPAQQTTYKKFTCFFNGYKNTSATAQTIAFPTAFAQTPVFTANIDPPCTVSASTLTLPVSMSATVSGWVIIEGY